MAGSLQCLVDDGKKIINITVSASGNAQLDFLCIVKDVQLVVGGANVLEMQFKLRRFQMQRLVAGVQVFHLEGEIRAVKPSAHC